MYARVACQDRKSLQAYVLRTTIQKNMMTENGFFVIIQTLCIWQQKGRRNKKKRKEKIPPIAFSTWREREDKSEWKEMFFWGGEKVAKLQKKASHC